MLLCLYPSSYLLYSIAYLLPMATCFVAGIQGELTYGKIGEWRFDKRSYDNVIPPRNLPLPPPGVPESVVRVLSPMNALYPLLGKYMVPMVKLVQETIMIK